jgi:hypothetical protein
MLTNDELNAVDDWRFTLRMPSRAAAIRELLRRGLAAEGYPVATPRSKSKDYGVVSAPQSARSGTNGRRPRA